MKVFQSLSLTIMLLSKLNYFPLAFKVTRNQLRSLSIFAFCSKRLPLTSLNYFSMSMQDKTEQTLHKAGKGKGGKVRTITTSSMMVGEDLLLQKTSKRSFSEKAANKMRTTVAVEQKMDVENSEKTEEKPNDKTSYLTEHEFSSLPISANTKKALAEQLQYK